MTANGGWHSSCYRGNNKDIFIIKSDKIIPADLYSEAGLTYMSAKLRPEVVEVE